MPATTNSDEAVYKAVLAIDQVKFTHNKVRGKNYLLILFNDPHWRRYVQKELFFRLVTKGGQQIEVTKFENVSAQPVGKNGLLIVMKGPLQGVEPEKINISEEPTLNAEFHKEYQLSVIQQN